jgi:hypothetical protein
MTRSKAGKRSETDIYLDDIADFEDSFQHKTYRDAGMVLYRLVSVRTGRGNPRIPWSPGRIDMSIGRSGPRTARPRSVGAGAPQGPDQGRSRARRAVGGRTIKVCKPLKITAGGPDPGREGAGPADVGGTGKSWDLRGDVSEEQALPAGPSEWRLDANFASGPRASAEKEESRNLHAFLLSGSRLRPRLWGQLHLYGRRHRRHRDRAGRPRASGLITPAVCWERMVRRYGRPQGPSNPFSHVVNSDHYQVLTALSQSRMRAGRRSTKNRCAASVHA